MPDALRRLILDVPDFPKPGVMYKDFTPLLKDPGALALAVELMANPYRGKGVKCVVGAESRGIKIGPSIPQELSTALVQALSAGFVPIRKPGKLPRAVHAQDYDLEYGSDRVELHADAIEPGDGVLLVDDLLATGGTLDACGHLLKQCGAELVGVTVLIELEFLKGRERLEHLGDIHAVVQYD